MVTSTTMTRSSLSLFRCPGCSSGQDLLRLVGWPKQEWQKSWRKGVNFGRPPESFVAGKRIAWSKRLCPLQTLTEISGFCGSGFASTPTLLKSKVLTFCRYLSEIGALQMVGEEDDDEPISLQDLYKKIAEQNTGCKWEHYEVYRYLKGLGYIVGRHGVPWTSKSVTTSSDEDAPVHVGGSSKDKDTITELFHDMQIRNTRAVFDVYMPNSRFKKSSPGDPSFVACFSGGFTPSKDEIQDLQRRITAPLMFCHVEQGRCSFFAFSSVDLPALP